MQDLSPFAEAIGRLTDNIIKNAIGYLIIGVSFGLLGFFFSGSSCQTTVGSPDLQAGACVRDWLNATSGWAAVFGAIFIGIRHLPWIKGQAQYPALQRQYELASQRLGAIHGVYATLKGYDSLILRAEQDKDDKLFIPEEALDRASAKPIQKISSGIADYVKSIPELCAALEVLPTDDADKITEAFLASFEDKASPQQRNVVKRHRARYNRIFSAMQEEREKQTRLVVTTSKRTAEILQK